MTETNPMGNDHPTAGEVGLRRQEPGTATPASAGPSLNVPEVHAPPKPYVKPVVSHGEGDHFAGLRDAAPRPDTAAEGRAGATGDRPDGADRHRGPVSEEDRLREDIVRTRQELGRTVEALAHKVDVKARAQDKVARTRAAAQEKVHEIAGRLRPAGAERAAGQGAGPAPDGARALAGRVAEGARRRPEVLIMLGAATMAGAGWLNWTSRRHRCPGG
ncbi:hypothetical protein Sru01_66250 [Sphaerisporangium rufum]|uniref:DUF3618 domain-containing protein n=1 Tax=Sphaerisporangium rufum TaxID=1381558 RepID=A0A919V4W7_9ACTN|nr:DUF3618 domain-containing protein [Sphaerisporangium rufum]GII81643.1 hypothetical protein Sru01_66250 [Sphaerisporangium rufum]